MEIHISRGEDRSGPFTLEQVQDYLAQGVLLPDDLAWHKDLVGWIPLSQLMDSIAAPIDPAPPQPITITSEPVQSEPTTDSEPIKADDKKKPMVDIGGCAAVIAIACVAVIAIVVGIWFLLAPKEEQSKAKTKQVSRADPTKHERFLWEFETGDTVRSSPAIGSDGTVYVGSWDNKLYAINGKSGAKLWEFQTGSFVHFSPAIGSDGTVYVGSEDNNLYAINGKSGAKLWEFQTGWGVRSSRSSLAIESYGTVYVGSEDKKLYAINGKSGVKLWEFETGERVYSSPAIGSDGTVYVGSGDNKLYAINGKTGDKLWEFETGGPVPSSPAIGSDGTVYVGSRDNKLYAIKTDSKGLAKSPWPMRGQNAQHTGRAPKK